MVVCARLLCLIPLAAILVGCGGRGALIERKPEWNYEPYERLAVLPVKLPSGAPASAARHADQMTTLLSDLLTQNGAFTIISRQELADVMREQDLASLDLADASTSVPSGMIQVAQALVIASIQDYDLARLREQRAVPVYRRDRRGRLVLRNGMPVKIGERRVNVFRHVARVGGNVRVVDTATGEVLFAHATEPIQFEKTQEKVPPSLTPEDLAGEAAAELAADFYTHLAPMRVKVEFDDKNIALATGYYDGEYDTIKKLPASADELLVVVRNLPRQCDRNRFNVAISEKDGRRDLFRDEFVWSAGMGARGHAFAVPTELLVDSGAREFTAKLYAPGNDAPVAERDFELADPD